MDQNRSRSRGSHQSEDMPNRESNMEPAEGSRETVRNKENSGGITNRPLDREQCEQEQLPERGHSQSER